VFFARKGNLSDAVEAYEDAWCTVSYQKTRSTEFKKTRSKLEKKTARDEALNDDLHREDGILRRIELAADRASPSLSGQGLSQCGLSNGLMTPTTGGLSLQL
jgi:hypothetical protein